MTARGGWLGAVLLGLLLLATPMGLGDPSIPTMGGVVVETGITGRLFGVAAEADEDFVAVGDTIDLTSAGSVRTAAPIFALVIKYDNTAMRQWYTTIDVEDQDTLFDVVLDGDGNAYAVGYSQSGSENVGLVVKVEPDGDVSWTRTFTFANAEDTQFFGLVLDGSELVIVGATKVDVGGAKLGGCIVGYSLSGTLNFARYFVNGTDENDVWAGISIADDDEYYIAGAKSALGLPSSASVSVKATQSSITWRRDGTSGSTFWGVGTLDGETVTVGASHTSDTVRQMNITRREADGDLAWWRLYGPGFAPNYFATAVTTDSGGDVLYATGNTGTYIDFDIDEALSTSFNILETSKIRAVKHEADGDLVWDTEYASTGNSVWAYGNTVDSEPRLIIVGMKYSTLADDLNPLVVRYIDL